MLVLIALKMGSPALAGFSQIRPVYFIPPFYFESTF